MAISVFDFRWILDPEVNFDCQAWRYYSGHLIVPTFAEPVPGLVINSPWLRGTIIRSE